MTKCRHAKLNRTELDRYTEPGRLRVTPSITYSTFVTDIHVSHGILLTTHAQSTVSDLLSIQQHACPGVLCPVTSALSPFFPFFIGGRINGNTIIRRLARTKVTKEHVLCCLQERRQQRHRRPSFIPGFTQKSRLTSNSPRQRFQLHRSIASSSSSRSKSCFKCCYG